MSTKLKNAGKLQAFFLSHGEKLGVALIVAVAGWLVYSSMGLEQEERKPPELETLVRNTLSDVNEYGWTDAVEKADPPPPVADDFKATAAESINPEEYALSRYGINRHVVQPIVLRRDPVLLPAQEVEGQGYTVLMPFLSAEMAERRRLDELRDDAQRDKEREAERLRTEEENDRGGRRRGRRDERDARELGPGNDPDRRPIPNGRRRGGASLNGDELVKVQSCAVVLAKVPVMDQLKIYQDVFENARGFDPSRDLPQYLGFYVERAEVRPGEELKWAPATVRNGSGGKPLPAVTDHTIPIALGDWVEEMEPLVDDRYFHPSLTFPLPAIVSRDWGPEVVHSDLPLAAETEALEQNMDDEHDPAASDLEDGNIFGSGEDSGRGFGEAGRGGGRTPRRSGRRGGGMGREYGGEMMMEPGFGGRGGRGGGGARRGGSRRGSGSAFSFEVPHAMVRFLDFNVQQGRRYKYRIQLLLLDVNGKGQVSGTHLEKDVRQRVSKTRRTATPFIKTEWSEPSSTISVPLAGNIYVAGAQSASVGEPTATLVVESFDIDPETRHAIQGWIEKDKIRRGAVMNMSERDIEIVEGKYLKKTENFNFRTGITVLGHHRWREAEPRHDYPCSGAGYGRYR